MKRIDLNDVFTSSEAEDFYGLAEGQVRQDIRRNKFFDYEYRKSGRNWLLIREGTDRVYGNKINAKGDHAK